MNWFLRLFAKKEKPQKRVDGQMPPFRSRMSPPLIVSASSQNVSKSSYKSESERKRNDDSPIYIPSFDPSPIADYSPSWSSPSSSDSGSSSSSDFGGGSFGGGGSSDSWSDSGSSSSSDSGSSSFSD